MAFALSDTGLPEDVHRALLEQADATADPQAAFHTIQAFAQNAPDVWPHLRHALDDPVSRRRLIGALGNSPYLTHVLRRWPEVLSVLGGPLPNIPHENRQVMQKIAETTTWHEVARLLRAHKHRCFFQIGCMDLSGEASLLEVVRAISDLADGCLEAGYRWLDHRLAARHGRPMVYDKGGEAVPARFAILGMGKLGARELNFSSDVDLIYLFDAGQGEVEGACALPLKGYFNRLGRDLIRLLGESTAEGLVFRIDLRLRPEGESADLSLSLHAAELYYESWGQTWERSAMIKARPVAADRALGETFLACLQPFIYRRYLDFGALDAIREMKHKIDRKMAAAADYHRNLKLGYGGIREIEFFVQSQQLIHGGKDPSLRHRETLTTLANLHAAGWLKHETSGFLDHAYRFLRMLEHRLQIQHDQQVHSIPEDPVAFEQLSKRAGMAHGAQLRQRLTEITSRVHAIYHDLFFEAKETHQASHNPVVERLLACEPEMTTCKTLLQQAGFQNPAQADRALQVVRDGPVGRYLTEWMRGWYRRAAGPLLHAICQAPNQDMALAHTETFLTSLGHRVSYLALLLENPAVLQLLVRLFGSSVLLSRYFIKHPELMDRLVTQGFFQHYRNRGALTTDLANLLEEVKDAEERFNLIREFKHGETLRLGVRDLSRVAELTEVMAGLSALADVILARVLKDALKELEKRHGSPNVPFVMVAMGKLGGRELNYESDLDLIFLHGGSSVEEQWTDGKNPLSITLFFTRLGQRIITSITTLTRAGKLYELDMRLRPSGNSGALVTSVEAFLRYQKHDAWVWEHQALTRARVVAGDPVLADQLHQAMRLIVRQVRDTDALRQEVRHMRQRMFEEKKPDHGWVDIKQSRGGIVDIEFLTQFFLLAFSHHYPDIVHVNTAKALRACCEAGLLDGDAYATLEDAYGFFRLVENRLRLLHGRSENRIGPDPVVREQLRRLCDLPEERGVVTVLEAHFQRAFAIVRHFLGEASPPLSPDHTTQASTDGRPLHSR